MNMKNIRELAEIIKNSELSLIEICEGETKIRLEKNTVVTNFVTQESAPVYQSAPFQKQETAQAPTEVVDFNNLNEVKSPMVGVFYMTPSPDAQPFVKLGDKVKKGDVLCIIEAMKLMNEIVAETDGEIVDICLNSGDIVEFGQTMFKLF